MNPPFFPIPCTPGAFYLHSFNPPSSRASPGLGLASLFTRSAPESDVNHVNQTHPANAIMVFPFIDILLLASTDNTVAIHSTILRIYFARRVPLNPAAFP
ncbi:hypothetical protein CVT24_009912 [Panaeolus cyanescens]|uniref:Uncharacterized protein n=1 Tax=Panaeolus cyanescens TaxID=181874 RepID=A0A409WW25_9AGAR|nr:hypothetical protein CVT24_009912 [Panaeolus cyanescens]